MKTFSKITITFLLFLAAINSLIASGLDTQFQAGNAAFLEGKYTEASKIYEALNKMGKESAELYYNLGNAYYQQEKIGLAILNYERAKRLAPSDQKTTHNLKITNALLSKKIESYPLVFYKRWWLNTVQFFSSGIWAFLALLSLWMALATAIFFVISKTASKKKKAFGSALALFALALLFTIFAFNKYQMESNDKEAIVMSEEVPLRSGPSASSKEVTFLPEGAKVQIVERLDKWLKVVLTDEKEGWVNVTEIEFI